LPSKAVFGRYTCDIIAASYYDVVGWVMFFPNALQSAGRPVLPVIYNKTAARLDTRSSAGMLSALRPVGKPDTHRLTWAYSMDKNT